MTDDIVTRLRELAIEERPLWRSPMMEAADEIERLRTERYRWEVFATHIATCINWGKRTCWDCVSPTNQDDAREAGLEDIIRSEYGK